jgi:hypothetical protein
LNFSFSGIGNILTPPFVEICSNLGLGAMFSVGIISFLGVLTYPYFTETFIPISKN